MELKRLTGRKTSEFLMRKGRRWRGKTINVHWLPGSPRKGEALLPPGVYIGTFASTKLDKSAVKRNRMRRRVREAFRLTVGEAENLPSVQLLVSPASASLKAPFEEIREDVLRFLSTLTHGR